MNRRRAVAALALAAGAAVLPFRAGAQAGRPRRVGFLSFAPAPLYYDAFRAGMAELGYVEGKSVVFHSRFGGGNESLDKLAAALVNERPDLVVAAGGPALRAVRAASAEVPVVFSFSGDPVAARFAQSLAQPGGNMSGISLLSIELVGKRIELLREAMPHIRSVAILANPDHPGEQLERKAAIAGTNALGLASRYFQAQTLAELHAALAAIVSSGAEGLVVFPDALTIAHRQTIAESALKGGLAAVSGWAEFAESGFLMSYGPSLQASYRRLATFADKVLKGANPGSLPIEQPTVVEMVINARSAQALGREIPRPVLARADRVLQ